MNDAQEQHESGAITKSDVGIIESGMANLERTIRELHDRLVTVMAPPDDNKTDGGEKQHTSPMSHRVSLMNELVTDIHHRLEL